jgi:hypothetical protein
MVNWPLNTINLINPINQLHFFEFSACLFEFIVDIFVISF